QRSSATMTTQRIDLTRATISDRLLKNSLLGRKPEIAFSVFELKSAMEGLFQHPVRVGVELLFQVVHVLGHLVDHGHELLILGLHVDGDLLEVQHPLFAGLRVRSRAVQLLRQHLELLGQLLGLLLDLGNLVGGVVVLNVGPLG
ncbi:MAG: hypothetical protein ACYDB9_02100, partial [Gammaproteobacteria bacterium]